MKCFSEISKKRRNCIVSLLALCMAFLLSSCGMQTDVQKEAAVLQDDAAKSDSSQKTLLEDKKTKSEEKHSEPKVTAAVEPTSEPASELRKITPEEAFDNVISYFTEKDTAGKSRHSYTTEATYYAGISAEEKLVQFMYLSDDKTQGVLISLDREGNLNITVKIQSLNEGVNGNVTMKAADYSYGYEFADFIYQSEQKNWDYEKFKIRANAYVQNTLLYAEGLLEDNLDLNLTDLGFSSWQNPGPFKKDLITAEDIAGMWDYKNPDNNQYCSRIYLVDDKVYWCGYEEAYADTITSTVMTESENDVFSEDIIMSNVDTLTGEVVVTDVSTSGNKISDQFRRYIYRNDSGELCMRVESVYGGMSNDEDGKIYVKMDNDRPVSITPQKYDPLMHESTEAKETEDKDTDKSNKTNISTYSPGNTSYQTILDEYTARMEKAVPGLVQEYESETAGISNIDQLAEICNEKVGELAEICNDGIAEMAELMYSSGDSYETYDKWATKLMENYSDIATEIQNAYLDSAAY